MPPKAGRVVGEAHAGSRKFDMGGIRLPKHKEQRKLLEKGCCACVQSMARSRVSPKQEKKSGKLDLQVGQHSTIQIYGSTDV